MKTQYIKYRFNPYLIGAIIIAGFAALIFLYPNLTYKNKDSSTSPEVSESPANEPQETARILRWVGCGVSKKAFMHELALAYKEKTGIKINLEGGGATRGIRDTATLNSDMGGSCRHILPVGAEENVILIQVAWDALVVIVNPGNPVGNIQLEQLKRVLAGNIKNWKELGGPDKKISLVIREQGPGGKLSGVGVMTRELVFFDREMTYTDDSTAVKSTGPLETIVEKNSWAMGITGISSAVRRDVKVLHLNGVTPSYENITSGKYLLFRPLYLVLPKDPEKRKPAEKFAAFALGDEGQKILKDHGTVNLEDGAVLWDEYMEKMFRAGVRMGDY